jgi:hypothetical protein
MDGLASLGKLIIFVGIAIVILGALILLVSALTGGRGAPLPGDIIIRGRHTTIYFPIVTGIVLSVILTLLLWLISALRR